MAKRNNLFKQFKHPGGIIGLPKRVFDSHAYADLSLTARCLLDELQRIHMPSINGRISLSVFNASKRLKQSQNTVRPAFKELEEHGFIERSLDADWLNGKAREWRLTYEKCQGREPTDEWQNWEPKN